MLRAWLEHALQRLWWQPHPTATARLLQPLTWLYRAIASLDRGRSLRAGPWRAPVPVIVIGNLIVGGAGKTPTTIAVVAALRNAGWRPGIVSRGHGRKTSDVREVRPDDDAGDTGDEPLLMARRTGVPVVVGARRAEAVRHLLAQHAGVDVVISDDGLQHHALARDLSVIVFDRRGVGNGLCLPAGPLRQPMADVAPPDALVLYNADRPTTAWGGALAASVLPGPVPFDAWRSGTAQVDATWDTLRGRPVDAVAGIASPQRFFDMLRDAGLEIRGWALPDHAALGDRRPWPTTATDVVMTEKDAAKLTQGMSHVRTWVAPLDFMLPPSFITALLQRVQQAAASRAP